MITPIATLRLFYPMLFLTIGIIAIVLIFAVKNVLIKFKDNDSENFRFKTHSDEHQDTTAKMKQMRDIVVPVKYTSVQEKELHYIECGLKELQYNVAAINKRVDDLASRVLQLENNS